MVFSNLREQTKSCCGALATTKVERIAWAFLWRTTPSFKVKTNTKISHTV